MHPEKYEHLQVDIINFALVKPEMLPDPLSRTEP